jgi:hypothetical protein
VLGVRFEVNFNHISDSKGKLLALRVGYCVRHKSQLTGKREVASFWRYGIELKYLGDDKSESATRLWLCKECHLARAHRDTRHINGTTFIFNHLKKVHLINPNPGLMPDPGARTSRTHLKPLELFRLGVARLLLRYRGKKSCCRRRLLTR